ncbi:MAG: elongation factor P hydroxylase [Alcanivoracaceae bacterium]|nr:elongation factor P hydroxylase [Alcanivoracaceae bacterium]
MRAATLTQIDRNGQQGNAENQTAKQLEALFDECFAKQFNTQLVGGAEEPFYRATHEGNPAEIHFSHDYFRSALHEIAHWCVAGDDRRQRDDYGYWYAPDGRDAEQQREFEKVEVMPQAWELLFCAASAHPFRVSMDNLDNSPCDVSDFEEAVFEQAKKLLRTVPRGRGWLWVQMLALHYRRTAGFQREWIGQVFTAW